MKYNKKKTRLVCERNKKKKIVQDTRASLIEENGILFPIFI